MIVDMPDLPGVYRISCKASNKFYIGCSQSMSNRFIDHFRKLMQGTHQNKMLQADWDKYGHAQFEFASVEVNEEYAERELYWLNRAMQAHAGRMYNRKEELVSGARDAKTGELRKAAKIKYLRNQFVICDNETGQYLNFKKGWSNKKTRYGNVGLIKKTIADYARFDGLEYWQAPSNWIVYIAGDDGDTFACYARDFWSYCKGELVQ